MLGNACNSERNAAGHSGAGPRWQAGRWFSGLCAILLALVLICLALMWQAAARERRDAWMFNVMNVFGSASLAYVAQEGQAPGAVQDLLDAEYLEVQRDGERIQVWSVAAQAGPAALDSLAVIRIQFPTLDSCASSEVEIGGGGECAPIEIAGAEQLPGGLAENLNRRILTHYCQLLRGEATGQRWLDDLSSSERGP